MKRPEKEIIFNRFYQGEMEKNELIALVKRLLEDEDLRHWFKTQCEYVVSLRAN